MVSLVPSSPASGHPGTPAGLTHGFRPAIAVCAALALLTALSALAIPAGARRSPAAGPAEATPPAR